MTIFNLFKKKYLAKCISLPYDERDIKIIKQLAELKDMVSRIEKAQQETVLQLEEIDAAINEGTDITTSPLIDIADIVYDFYCFAHKDDALKVQAQMMWNNAKKILCSAGIDILEPTGEQFNYNLHEAHDTVADTDIPYETITATLRCGYIHEGKILRRATVVVNKST